MRATILFVHGAGHGGWCWRENFTGWFEARGYTVSAPDLPAHGDRDRSGVKRIPLSTYVDFVGEAARSLQPPVILVGHSMGGFIIQKHLETESADLAVLLASVAPGGVSRMVARLVTRRPRSFLHTIRTSEATVSAKGTRDFFFSPETPNSVVESAHARLQPESTRVLADMMLRLHPERTRSPFLVMGAQHDWLVAPAPDLRATASALRTEPITMPGGHDMMLDVAWEQVAERIDRSVQERLGRLAA